MRVLVPHDKVGTDCELCGYTLDYGQVARNDDGTYTVDLSWGCYDNEVREGLSREDAIAFVEDNGRFEWGEPE